MCQTPSAVPGEQPETPMNAELQSQRDEPKMNRFEELEFSSLHFVMGLI